MSPIMINSSSSEVTVPSESNSNILFPGHISSNLSPIFCGKAAYVSSGRFLLQIWPSTGRLARRVDLGPGKITAICTSQKSDSNLSADSTVTKDTKDVIIVATVIEDSESGTSSSSVFKFELSKESDFGDSKCMKKIDLMNDKTKMKITKLVSDGNLSNLLYAIVESESGSDASKSEVKESVVELNTDDFSIERTIFSHNIARTCNTTESDSDRLHISISRHFLAISQGTNVYLEFKNKPNSMTNKDSSSSKPKTTLYRFTHKNRITGISIDPKETHIAIGDNRGILHTCHIFGPENSGAIITSTLGSVSAVSGSDRNLKQLQNLNVNKNHKKAKKESDLKSSNTDHIIVNAGPLNFRSSGFKHWHARAITALGHMAPNIIYTGGHEGVLVIYNKTLDSLQFYPRIGNSGSSSNILENIVFDEKLNYFGCFVGGNVVFIDSMQSNHIRRYRGLEKRTTQLNSNIVDSQLQLLSPTSNAMAIRTGDNQIQFLSNRSDINKSSTIFKLNSSSLEIESVLDVHERNYSTETAKLNNRSGGPISQNNNQSQSQSRPWILKHFKILQNAGYLCTVEERSTTSEGTSVNCLIKWWKKDNSTNIGDITSNSDSNNSWILDSCVYDAHSDHITSLLGYDSDDINPTSRDSFLITTSKDGLLKKWTLESTSLNQSDRSDSSLCWQSTAIQLYKDKTAIDSASLLSDGTAIAISCKKSILIWDSRTLENLVSVDSTEDSESGIFRHYGNKDVVLNSKAIKSEADIKEKIMRITTDKNLSETDSKNLNLSRTSEKSNQISQLEFAVINERLCLLSLGYGTVNLWDLESQKLMSIMTLESSDESNSNSASYNIEKFAWNSQTGHIAIETSSGTSREVKVFQSSSMISFPYFQEIELAHYDSSIKLSSPLSSLAWSYQNELLLLDSLTFEMKSVSISNDYMNDSDNVNLLNLTHDQMIASDDSNDIPIPVTVTGPAAEYTKVFTSSEKNTSNSTTNLNFNISSNLKSFLQKWRNNYIVISNKNTINGNAITVSSSAASLRGDAHIRIVSQEVIGGDSVKTSDLSRVSDIWDNFLAAFGRRRNTNLESEETFKSVHNDLISKDIKISHNSKNQNVAVNQVSAIDDEDFWRDITSSEVSISKSGKSDSKDEDAAENHQSKIHNDMGNTVTTQTDSTQSPSQVKIAKKKKKKNVATKTTSEVEV